MRSLPQDREAKHDEKDVDAGGTEQNEREHAARIAAKTCDEGCERRMVLFERAELMRPQSEEGRLEAGKERGTDNEPDKKSEQRGEQRRRHFAFASRSRVALPIASLRPEYGFL